MRIIAIDPGYERLGIAILSRRSIDEQNFEGEEKINSNQKETLLFSECFKTKASLPFFDRLELVGREVPRFSAQDTANGFTG